MNEYHVVKIWRYLILCNIIEEFDCFNSLWKIDRYIKDVCKICMKEKTVSRKKVRGLRKCPIDRPIFKHS